MNADCVRAEALWLEAADGDLAQEQAEWLKRHLAECAACREKQQQFARVDSTLTDFGVWCEQPVEEQPRARVASRWIPPAVAAMAAAALLGIALLRPAPTPADATQSPEFVPVPYVLPLQPDESAQVMRMEVPVAALQAAGYHVGMVDPAAVMPAEVLVGEDGRVHAVRLLSNVTLN